MKKVGKDRNKILGNLKYLIILLFLTQLNPISRISVQAEDIPDPLERMNRGIFWFNNNIDEYVIEPVAKGYKYITPNPVRRSVKNFFLNLNYPILLVSDVLQLKFSQAANHTGRFLVNSTAGLLGFFEVASDLGMQPHKEDLGSAFGNWGIGPGAYLVLPILGPSSIRDGIGFAGETFLSPTIAVTYSNMKELDKNLILYGSNSFKFINIRADLIETIDSAKEASLDYYSFVKHAYQQDRQALIYDGMPPEEDELDEDFGHAGSKESIEEKTENP